MQISPVSSQKLNKANLILPSPQKIEDKKINTYFKSLFENDRVENALNNMENYTAVAGVPPGIPNKCEDNDKIPINKCLSLINDYDGSYGPWSSIQIIDDPKKAPVPPEQLAYIVECMNLNFLENFGRRLISSLNFGNDTQKLPFECTLIKGVLEGQVCVYNICKEPSEIYRLGSENFIIGCFNASAPPAPTPTPMPTPINNNSSSSAEWAGGLVLTLLVVPGALLALIFALKKIKTVLKIREELDKSNIPSPENTNFSNNFQQTPFSPNYKRRYNGSLDELQDYNDYYMADNPSSLYEDDGLDEPPQRSNCFTRLWGRLTRLVNQSTSHATTRNSTPVRRQRDTSSPDYDTL